jgi:S1-C subfamily serine protease
MPNLEAEAFEKKVNHILKHFTTLDPVRKNLSAEPMEKLHVEVPLAADGSRGDVSETYKVAAPATVLIRAANGGYGSGVLVDRRGWVLTNHHVVDQPPNAKGHIVVDVEVGRLGAEGVMERTKERHKAWVYKWDSKRDLAVLKLDNPPAALSTVEFAETGPAPGEEVACLGHGNSGLVWSIKSGNVSATGEMTDLSSVVGHGCSEDEEKKKLLRCRYISERRKFWKKNSGKVIQSTCHIVGGDSGGPVLNTSNQLVGVNAFGIPSGRDAPPTNYHVHLDEIRAFLEDVPDKPLVHQSKEREERWGDVKREVLGLYDVDQDQIWDVLVVRGPRMVDTSGKEHRTVAYVADLDQDTTKGVRTKADAQALWAANRVDYELLVWNRIGRAAVHLLDIDNDGRWDVNLYSANGSTVMKEQEVQDPKLRGAFIAKLLWRPEFFRNKKVRKRYRALFEGLASRAIPDSEWKGIAHFPHPIVAKGASYKVRHRLAFGTKVATSANDHQKSWIVDLRGKAAPALEKAPLHKAGKTRFDFACVVRSGMIWAYYDTSGNGKVDLVKVGLSGYDNSHLARGVFHVDRRGRTTIARELVGTPLFSFSHYKKKSTQEQMKRLLPYLFTKAE